MVIISSFSAIKTDSLYFEFVKLINLLFFLHLIPINILLVAEYSWERKKKKNRLSHFCG